MFRKVCIVTGARSEYGLLSALMKTLQCDEFVELQVIATGMHLSPEFGLTYLEIEKDGFTIDEKIEMVVSSDTSVGVVKSIGLGLIGFADSYNRLAPDIVVVLGDRYEAFAAAQSATIMNIPVAHLHGGEVTEGAVDESLRHAITKLSHLHFVSTEEFRQRVIQLGENPENVVISGALGVDSIKRMELLSRSELEDALDISFMDGCILVTYHPVTLSPSSEEERVSSLLSSLEKYSEYRIVITYPNADAGGRAIVSLLKKFAAKAPSNTTLVESLDYRTFVSLMSVAEIVVGNSSSGLIEAPCFSIPTVNIGDRQKGRPLASSVLSCQDDEQSIQTAMDRALSNEFRQSCRDVDNPYGRGDAVKEIVSVLKSVSLDGLVRKSFYDVLP